MIRTLVAGIAGVHRDDLRVDDWLIAGSVVAILLAVLAAVAYSAAG